MTEDQKAREKAFFWATQSKEKALWYQHEEIGYNYRMSNIVAGIGRGQLKYIEEHRKRKEEIYYRYKKGLRGLSVRMNPYLPDTRPNFWLSCMLIDEDCKTDPIEIINVLNRHNIEARPIWKPMHMQPLFRNNDFVVVEDTPVDEEIFAKGLCLPSDIKMMQKEQDYVIEIIKSCF